MIPTSYYHTTPISESTLCHYLSTIRAWHIAQGWLPPLSDIQQDHIDLSLRGIAHIQADHHRKPPGPPVTVTMLHLFKDSLDLNSPFDACIWAIASCAFWAMMRLGEGTVKSRAAFQPTTCLTRKDTVKDANLDGHTFVRINLPSAKTTCPGESQSVWLVPQGSLCPIKALKNLGRIAPAQADNPLFPWCNNKHTIHPMTKPSFLDRVNRILTSHGSERVYGHSFRIGGASYYMAHKMDMEVVKIAGRWQSISYQLYIRRVEQVISRRFADLPEV